MNCGSCHFQDKEGRCHRYPPTPILQEVDGMPLMIPEWVVVSVDDWCGEYLKESPS